MEPEEIDKLFRDKLAGRPGVPSPDAWMRLQQKMEPPKKQRTLWIYYAAASLAVLVVSAMVLLNRGGDASGPAVATAPRVVAPAGNKPVESSPVRDRQPEQMVAQVPVSPAGAPVPASTLEKKMQPSSRPANRAVRPAAGLPVQAPVVAAAMQPAPVKHPETAKSVTPAVQTPAMAQAGPDLSVVEVVVQRAADTAPDEAPTLRDQLSRKGHLLRNIYKQARNLKNGEPVELAAIGVDKDRIQEETKELKQKITNVISL